MNTREPLAGRSQRATAWWVGAVFCAVLWSPELRGATPNDPFFVDGTQWALHNVGQNGGLPGADIDAPEAWDTRRTAANVIVAILDSGVRYTHEDLAANMWVNPGEIPGNGKDDDHNGYIDDVHGIDALRDSGDPWDERGHGTHVAGIIGAVGNNGRGLAGVAWQVQLMALKFIDAAGNGSTLDAVQCLDYARLHGAHIINASWSSTNASPLLDAAIARARQAGIIVVTSAGNDGANNDVAPRYPANSPYDNVVTVTATTRIDSFYPFGNYGPTTVDLAAPGSAIVSTAATGDHDYATGSGTSSAAPFVSGALALLRARFPAATYQELIERVLTNTTPLPELAGKCRTGGRLNLARALGPPAVARLLSPMVQGGHFTVAVEVEAGLDYSVEASTDLQTWLPLTLTSRGDGPVTEFVDPSPVSGPRRFYRATVVK